MNVTITGIPIYSGAYVSGTELAPAALRAAGLMTVLQEQGIPATDRGDLVLPAYLPRHNVPPVRNWPAPRMVWDLLREEARGCFGRDQFSLFLGGDCSVIVGTAQAFRDVYGDKAYLLVLDGHVDARVPSASRCVGAAGMGLWFLLQGGGVWIEETGWTADRIAVLGCQQMPDETLGVEIVTLDQLCERGPGPLAADVLQAIPSDAHILVHFDVDVMHKEAMAAAYSPSETGLSQAQTEELLSTVLADPRVVGVNVTEFSALRDVTGEQASRLVRLLGRALAARKTPSGSDTI
ncbi:arginase [Brevibacillus aydinogluensis]|uniref:arginase family protein n=1 Tax=Brevibacillus aydinogluensis TaxID=927786 RepID=UPI002892E5BB|nr:arginase family protein [Brevibacillus aydinogluensis]MDT3417269.1 arginase [Brevibacillus aydinogluensis]